MRISELYFERTKPGYNNRKCGIKIMLEEKDKLNEALKKAEEFVAIALNESLPDGQQMECVLKSCKKRKVPKDEPESVTPCKTADFCPHAHECNMDKTCLFYEQRV